MQDKKDNKKVAGAKKTPNDLFMAGLSESDEMHREAMRKAAEERVRQADQEK